MQCDRKSRSRTSGAIDAGFAERAVPCHGHLDPRTHDQDRQPRDWPAPAQARTGWPGREVVLLAHSINRGFHIGSPVLWHERYNLVGPHPDPTHHTEWFVVDGHPRLTALCAMFGQQPHWQEGPMTHRVQFNPQTQQFRSVPPSPVSPDGG